MKYIDSFSSCHPLVNFLYFIAVAGFTMCFHHPVTLLISLTFSIIYDIMLEGGKAVRFALIYMIPLALAAMLINPAFNHRGVTILLYLPTGNPLTLESILFGAAASVMIVAVIMWFRSYSKVMTSDKFIYLFGRIVPSLSLTISMALRFIPLFKNRFSEVYRANSSIIQESVNNKRFHKLKRIIKVTSIVVTWSLENAIETADSMKSRGYGQKGRTAFSIYKFEQRDKYILIWLLVCIFFIVSGGIAGGFAFWYYPAVTSVETNALTFMLQIAFALLCATPVCVDIREELHGTI